MKGQKLLKVCSILMIIFGVLNILAVVGMFLAADVLASMGLGVFTTPLLQAISCALAVCLFVAGIVGVKAAGAPSVNKIKAAVILGILTVVLALASNIYSIVLFQADYFSIASGLVVPVLYVVGVIQFKNALLELLSGD